MRCAGNAKDSSMDLDNDYYYHHHLRLHVESGFVRMTAATHLSGTKTKHITVGVVIVLIIIVHYLKYIIFVLNQDKTFHCVSVSLLLLEFLPTQELQQS